MKKLTIRNHKRQISDTDILDFESKYGIQLPTLVKEIFLQYNGARVLENCYLFNKVKYIVTFLPLLLNKFDASVELILPAVKDEEEGIGRSDLIPFATDPGGRPFYVSIGGNDEGTVYYDLVGLGFDEPLRKIADSFEEFINGLKTEDLASP